ncbi:MAG: hypothetical protein DI556_13075 [Rhodovulum sulfidophilum]|uniref:Uncharacterized protein n=1 Tax=Rhodovulum sulfidophilum TaxID=35806 RepID=A0A2W5N6M4_RHOSU|nr:MAG: hypothetical protein DI556_13075 [Rhodovulum sulfidophilum]
MKLIDIANRILKDNGLLLSSRDVGQLHRLRHEFTCAISDPRTSVGDAEALDAARDVLEVAIEMFDRSSMHDTSEALLRNFAGPVCDLHSGSYGMNGL